MRTSDAGIAAIKSHEGLRLYAYGLLTPPESAADFVYQRGTDIQHARNRWGVRAGRQSLAHMPNLVGSEFAAWVGFAAQVDKAIAPLQLRVLLKSHPFKIAGTVVNLDAVDVVDGKLRIKVFAERGCHKSVNQKLCALRPHFYGDHLIALPSNVWRQHAAISKLRRASGNRRLGKPVKHSNSSEIADFNVRRRQGRRAPLFLCVHREIVL